MHIQVNFVVLWSVGRKRRVVASNGAENAVDADTNGKQASLPIDILDSGPLSDTSIVSCLVAGSGRARRSGTGKRAWVDA